MRVSENSSQLPSYHRVQQILEPLQLPISISEIHGLFCGYICAGTENSGESYIRSVLSGFKKEEARDALLCLFELYTFSQQQIDSGDFSFYMLLPDSHETLMNRAQAFSEWCEGFSQGMHLSDVHQNDFSDAEAQEALSHIQEFAQLDYEELSVEESDEKALMEVSEYTRMAVLRLYTERQMQKAEQSETKQRH